MGSASAGSLCPWTHPALRALILPLLLPPRPGSLQAPLTPAVPMLPCHPHTPCPSSCPALRARSHPPSPFGHAWLRRSCWSVPVPHCPLLLSHSQGHICCTKGCAGPFSSCSQLTLPLCREQHPSQPPAPCPCHPTALPVPGATPNPELGLPSCQAPGRSSASGAAGTAGSGTEGKAGPAPTPSHPLVVESLGVAGGCPGAEQSSCCLPSSQHPSQQSQLGSSAGCDGTQNNSPMLRPGLGEEEAEAQPRAEHGTQPHLGPPCSDQGWR